MGSLAKLLLLFASILSTALADLPICPANIQFLPQNLPMHCRMPPRGLNPQPSKSNNTRSPGLPSSIPQGLQYAMPSGSYPLSLGSYLMPPAGSGSAQVPPGAMQMSSGAAPMPMQPGGIPMPMPVGMPLPPGMPMPGPAPKLPVIVMPFYSPESAHRHSTTRRPKRQHPRYSYTDSEDTDYSYMDTSDTDTSSDEDSYWRGERRSGRRTNRKHKSRRMKDNSRTNLLTPLLQYVTKDGYVIFEKKISAGEAKDWLDKKDVSKTIKPTATMLQHDPAPMPGSVEDKRELNQIIDENSKKDNTHPLQTIKRKFSHHRVKQSKTTKH